MKKCGVKTVRLINFIKSLISVGSIRRPLANTKVVADNSINNDYNISNENEDVSLEKDFKVELIMEVVRVSCVVFFAILVKIIWLKSSCA